MVDMYKYHILKNHSRFCLYPGELGGTYFYVVQSHCLFNAMNAAITVITPR